MKSRPLPARRDGFPNKTFVGKSPFQKGCFPPPPFSTRHRDEDSRSLSWKNLPLFPSDCKPGSTFIGRPNRDGGRESAILAHLPVVTFDIPVTVPNLRDLAHDHSSYQPHDSIRSPSLLRHGRQAERK